MDLRQPVSEFLTYCRLVRRVTPRTERLYTIYLDRWVLFWAPEGRAGKVPDPRVVERFLASQARRGLGDAAIRSAYGILRAFFRWAAARQLMQDPTIFMKPPLCHDSPRLVVDDEGAAQLFAAVKRSGRVHAQRDHAALAVCYYAGLRVTEALQLQPEAVDLRAGVIHVLGKGGKRRDVPLHPALSKILGAWLRVRPRSSPWLFPAQARHRDVGGPLDSFRLRTVLRRVYGPRAGLRRVTPHALRRGAATVLRRRGVPIEYVQRFLGHSQVETTRRYIGDTPEELRDAVRKL